MQENTTAATITNAQLYWDSQDPRNTGWWLRYTDADGVEQGDAIDGTEDDGTEELAGRVAASLRNETGRVAVYRGEQRRGWIEVSEGRATDWRV